MANTELGLVGEGAERKSIKAIDVALGDMLNARKKRMEWGKKEQEAQASLIELFHKHNVEKYSFDDDELYELQGKEKIVKAKPQSDDGEE